MKRLLLLIALSSWFISTTKAQPCYSSPQGCFWHSAHVTFYINDNMGTNSASHAEFVNGTLDAAQTLTYVPGSSFWFSYASERAENYTGTEQGFNIVGWQLLTDVTVLARTTTFWNPVDGMVEAQTCFNQVDGIEWSISPSVSQWDIQSTITHELGHWLKLMDEYDDHCSGNTMYYGQTAGSTSKRYLSQDDEDGIRWLYGNPTAVATGPGSVPATYRLLQNYPNPFNPSTTIQYELPTESYVRLAVYNMLGQKVATLVDGTQPGGYYAVSFQAAANVPSGMYIYRLQASATSDVRAYVEVGKMALLK